MPHQTHGHAHGHGEAIEGRHSNRYDRMARLLLKPLYRKIAKDIAASAPQGAGVLDVGTGPGILLKELGRIRPDLRLAGIDLAADMIDHAKHNLGDGIELHATDVAALPFEDNSFDLVVSTFSSHHWSDPEAGAGEIARVLRREGRFLNYDFPRAPFEVLKTRPELAFVGQERFSSIMKATRFEATKQP